jgi:hypothetical protein
MADRVVVQANDGIEHFEEVGLALDQGLQKQLLQKIDLFLANLQSALNQSVQKVASLSEFLLAASQQTLKTNIFQYLLELGKIVLVILFS